MQMRIAHAEALDVLNRYVTFLDERRFDAWLDLFTEDCYYTMILHEDFVKGNRMVAIGEDKPRLAGRIEVGQTVERARTTHLLTAAMAEASDSGMMLTANFSVIRKGVITVWGRYALELIPSGDTLKICKAAAILNNEILTDTQYLPV
jgi:3-phenylpropionate/cinnamic acid dioxygenase small subunit